MDIAKSLFSLRDHEGYVDKEGHNKRELELAVQEDEFEDESLAESLSERLEINSALMPSPGGPFSALTPSMWPQNIMAKLAIVPEDPNSQPEYRFDEFGFRVDEEDGPEQNSNKLLVPFVEDPQHRLQWIAHLEFSHNTQVSALTWDKIHEPLPRTDKLEELVKAGISHSLRPHIWMRLSGAVIKKEKSELCYKDIVRMSSSDSLMTSKQIEKDLLHIMSTNACFSHANSTGIPRLRRILRGLAWLYPDIGYCQGTGTIVASLLLLLEEEDAFWIMVAIVEDLLPACYYSSSLIGVQADQRVLRTLITSYLPDFDNLLKNHDIELSLITLQWFLTLFANVVHMKILLRLWDLFFYHGAVVLFQLTLGMFKMKEPYFKSLENSAQIFNALAVIPSEVDDMDNLLEVSMQVASKLSVDMIATYRRRHLAYLMADQGALVGNPDSTSHLPKQHLARRQIKKNKSVIQLLLFNEQDENDLKSKNIKQTEILVDLREAILQVAKHFVQLEPKNNFDVMLVADYSMGSHTADHANYINVSKNRNRRAKALLDFERHDDDELGFRKNDIITIISQKDEHCWIGELNGLRGWFPAKFVELLDERSKQYSSAGDDSISETVTDLVRGTLCPVLKQVLEHGMKRPNFLGGPCHPWLFIEEAATKEVEKDFNSVYSRLVLCKTYRLDEDGKVLTPEELLYRCVQAINLSHDNAHAQMDVKLRSLVCMGLNEQVFHLWLEVLCSCSEVVQKWYHPWSFVFSPGWVQIKCELRVLSQLSFNLNPDWELPVKKETNNQPLKDGVRDMLVKHHLFSWDI